MKKLFIGLFFQLFFCQAYAENWPQFRGPTGQGHSMVLELPMNWNQTEGVAWQSELSGKAWSSPICVNEQI